MPDDVDKIFIRFIGCCGAYCKTCPALINESCRGCKLGYDTGDRDIHKAKCQMKICCINKKYETCSDCQEYNTCEIIQGFYSKNGYKYNKYKQATEYIKKYGYAKFIEVANKWQNAYGKY
ncbi:MAG: hypothetical protein AMQ22_00793 [Candidatus Methanofastidiosum methylothiophilum]|uniref:DUF3795 domain-containing protein n=1 Tax=Candidatus Methanofastidiosum methylothiophilum TaxID=1705564 RepID=A0A150J5D8_9EURY|nr:MAG: hypothetical protein AMQ22_00793 [Candidatus Methanofastidiosum methylthiophilus]